MRPKTPSFDALIQNHGICLSTEGRSQNTIDWYANNLRRFLKFLRGRELPDEVLDIGVAEARSFIFYLQNEVTRWENSPRNRDEKRLSPFSVQGYARTIKAFWAWLSPGVSLAPVSFTTQTRGCSTPRRNTQTSSRATGLSSAWPGRAIPMRTPGWEASSKH